MSIILVEKKILMILSGTVNSSLSCFQMKYNLSRYTVTISIISGQTSLCQMRSYTQILGVSRACLQLVERMVQN